MSEKITTYKREEPVRPLFKGGTCRHDSVTNRIGKNLIANYTGAIILPKYEGGKPVEGKWKVYPKVGDTIWVQINCTTVGFGGGHELDPCEVVSVDNGILVAAHEGIEVHPVFMISEAIGGDDPLYLAYFKNNV